VNCFSSYVKLVLPAGILWTFCLRIKVTYPPDPVRVPDGVNPLPLLFDKGKGGLDKVGGRAPSLKTLSVIL